MPRYSKLSRLIDRAKGWWTYCSETVWQDHRDILKVRIVKTLNLTVRSLVDGNLYNQACAMTYRTLLAIVPVLALLFAIGRGFGFQSILQNQLYNLVPSQRQALEMAISFVDSCLAQASEGLFVGVGILFLLYTIFTLLDAVEVTFNNVWGVSTDRSLFSKVTDYLAICIILPILMIVSGGLQVFMSTTIQKLLPFDVLTPVLELVFDGISFIFGCLFFVGAYLLIPNTKVKFSNALVAGFIAGTGFQLLQWAFLHLQILVSKYNAIYGTFSFLPILLFWLQLSWLITLIGALICSASQNLSMYMNQNQIRDISHAYRRTVGIALLTVILKRFKTGEEPLTPIEMSSAYNLPLQLTAQITKRLEECGLVVEIVGAHGGNRDIDRPLLPARSLDYYTMGRVTGILDTHGEADFIPGFDEHFANIRALCEQIEHAMVSDSTNLSEIQIN